VNSSAWFDQLSAELRSAGVATPVIVLDLDRLDHNLALLAGGLSHRYRVVTKSLPSGELIRYILDATGANRLMAFHLPFVPWMLEAFPDTDILLGKPFLVAAADAFFTQISAGVRSAAQARIQWLVDTPTRLDEYLALAGRVGAPIRVNIEIDVGLHRGGVADADELHMMLAKIAAHPGRLLFAGFMGYDAHVPFWPDPDDAFAKAMQRYAQFIDYGRDHFPALFEGELTFNSGGSKTWFRFDEGLAVNDVAAGSAAVKPSTFSLLAEHRPALFIAAPVIRKFPRVSRREVDPTVAMSLYLYGGGWAADIVHPDGITISPSADPPNQNLLPNQCLFETHMDTPLGLGDFVFFQPHQGDAMVQFEEILVIRGGRLVDRWRPFPRRY